MTRRDLLQLLDISIQQIINPSQSSQSHNTVQTRNLKKISWIRSSLVGLSIFDAIILRGIWYMYIICILDVPRSMIPVRNSTWNISSNTHTHTTNQNWCLQILQTRLGKEKHQQKPSQQCNISIHFYSAVIGSSVFQHSFLHFCHHGISPTGASPFGTPISK